MSATFPGAAGSRIGIVGDAPMTAGIAQVLALAGFSVRLYSHARGISIENLDFARQMIARQVKKERISADLGGRAIQAMQPADKLEQLQDCAIVIESMLDDQKKTQSCIEQLENTLGDHCIIALNTSSLPVTVLAGHARRPERIVGLHFFDPVPLMPAVEVIRGLHTSSATYDTVTRLVKKIGHHPIPTADSPGFVVNLVGRALLTEGLRIRQERISTPQTIDAIVRASLGLRMGPFELLDMIGLDISAPNIERIYTAFQYEPRLQPTPELALRSAAGMFGRKSGKGYYQDCGQETDIRHDYSALPTVWIDATDPVRFERVHAHLKGTPALLDPGKRPLPSSLCIVMPLGEDTSTFSTRTGLDPTRTVGVDAAFSLTAHATLMAPPVIAPSMQQAALSVFAAAGPVSWIQDSPGFIAQRMLAAVVNLASDAAQQEIAEPEHIDLAMRLASGYPQGPLEMGDRFGVGNIATVLGAIHETYADPRYRCSPWLRRRAQLGISLLASPPAFPS
ncbi:MAG: 3-hydroxyacyl-CoA dehydrogenase NAD-binding domain-containing protein [Pusillimonas sp.]